MRRLHIFIASLFDDSSLTDAIVRSLTLAGADVWKHAMLSVDGSFDNTSRRELYLRPITILVVDPSVFPLNTQPEIMRRLRAISQFNPTRIQVVVATEYSQQFSASQELLHSLVIALDTQEHAS